MVNQNILNLMKRMMTRLKNGDLAGFSGIFRGCMHSPPIADRPADELNRAGKSFCCDGAWFFSSVNFDCDLFLESCAARFFDDRFDITYFFRVLFWKCNFYCISETPMAAEKGIGV